MIRNTEYTLKAARILDVPKVENPISLLVYLEKTIFKITQTRRSRAPIPEERHLSSEIKGHSRILLRSLDTQSATSGAFSRWPS